GKVDSYSIQRRPYGGGNNWTTVAFVSNPAPPPNLLQQLGGDYEYRATVTINGVDFTTPDIDVNPVKVLFPSYTTIERAPAVVAAAKAAWADAKAFVNQNHDQLREEGFWIQFNTANGAFTMTPTLTHDVPVNS